MEKMLSNTGLLVLRIFAGGTMLIAHGWPKLIGFKDKMDVFPDPLGLGSSLSLGLAIGAEAGCAALVLLGIATRLASIPLAITMAVAVFIVHSSDPFGQKELAFMYLGIYLSLACFGGGDFVLLKGKKPWLA